MDVNMHYIPSAGHLVTTFHIQDNISDMLRSNKSNSHNALHLHQHVLIDSYNA